MISAATASDRARRRRPGARCVNGDMRLNRCVAWRTPAAIAACASLVARAGVPEGHAMAAAARSADQVERPRRVPARASRCRRCRASRPIARRIRRRRERRRPGRHGPGGRDTCAGTRAGCAPFHSGLMKLLSRCAGSTRRERPVAPAAPAPRRRATSRSAAGAHATDVGQNAVTPKLGSRGAPRRHGVWRRPARRCLRHRGRARR